MVIPVMIPDLTDSNNLNKSRKKPQFIVCFFKNCEINFSYELITLSVYLDLPASATHFFLVRANLFFTLRRVFA